MKKVFSDDLRKLLENKMYLYYSSGLLNMCKPKPDIYVWDETLQKYENKDL